MFPFSTVLQPLAKRTSLSFHLDPKCFYNSLDTIFHYVGLYLPQVTSQFCPCDTQHEPSLVHQSLYHIFPFSREWKLVLIFCDSSLSFLLFFAVDLSSWSQISKWLAHHQRLHLGLLIFSLELLILQLLLLAEFLDFQIPVIFFLHIFSFCHQLCHLDSLFKCSFLSR